MTEQEWISSVSTKIKNKLKVTAKRNAHKIPNSAVNGVFDDKSGDGICCWTNGFWGGLMWQLYYATKDSMYMEIAQDVERKMDKNLMTARWLTHDNGFKWLLTAVADYKLTNNQDSLNRGLLAAENLAGKLNPAAKMLRAWNDDGDGSKANLAIIDCMMNLPLLYWAYEHQHDPRYLQIAQIHADSVIENFIRLDGSVRHIVVFDPVTGEVIGEKGGQGFGEGSSWTRGQAWAIYGFVISYIHTGKKEYLNAAIRVANYFIANLPESFLVPVDFRQPVDVTIEDSSAAAIAACGMIEISNQLEGRDADTYHRAGVKLLRTLDEKRCNWDEAIDHIVEKSTAAYHGYKHETEILFGDYYFIEGIFKLSKEGIYLW